jgi:hypothetical protein
MFDTRAKASGKLRFCRLNPRIKVAIEERPRREGSGSGALRLPLKADALYFALMFVLGWLIGPVRELLIVPPFRPGIGMAVEAILMVGAMLVVLHRSNWRREVPSAIGTRVIMGLVALGLLLPAEMARAWMFRGQTPTEVLLPADAFSGVVQWGLLLIFAIMPLLVRRRWTFGDEIAS